ncbi:MAG TPA: hypothetical protein VEO54_15840 [Thermoanaerobaculia bacterium]|nr:hypothetical protein [Thermoanaerobaculia bacterium]
MVYRATWIRRVGTFVLICAAITVTVPAYAQFNFDAGIMKAYFKISEAEIIKKEFRDPLGHVSYFDVLSFTVESIREFMGPAMFFAYFYDNDGIEIDNMSPVEFAPNAMQWREGTRSRVSILLPLGERRRQLRVIQVRDLYGG